MVGAVLWRSSGDVDLTRRGWRQWGSIKRRRGILGDGNGHDIWWVVAAGVPERRGMCRRREIQEE